MVRSQLLTRTSAQPSKRATLNSVGSYFGLAALAAITAWTYWGSLTAPFHFDDSLFLQSARVTDPRAWIKDLDPTQLRQFTYLTFHWNYRLGGTEPAGYHAANLGIHLVNVLLLYLVARLLFAKRPQASSEPTGRWPSLAAAGIFALHPIQSEAVNYVYQRSVLLAGFFALICAAALFEPAEGWKRRILVSVAAVSFLLAVASKESAVVLPLVAVAFGWSSLAGRRTFQGSFTRRHRAIVLSTTAATAAAAWMLLILYRGGESTVGFRLMTKAWSYVLAQIQVFALYLRFLAWPWGLSIDHAYRPAPPLSVYGVASALLLVAVVVGIVRLRSKDPLAAFLAAAFLILLLPTSSFIPSVDLMFEHRLYLPMMAGSTLLAWAGWRICAPWAARRPALITAWAAAVVILLAGYAGLSHRRTFIWGDDIRLWKDAVDKAPWSPRAHYNLAVATLGVDRDAAKTEFLKTLELQADHVGALYNMGWMEQTAGRFDDARSYYIRTLKLDPAFWQAHQNLGNVLVIQGRFEEAEAHYRQVVTYRSDYWPAYQSLATLQIQRGNAAAGLATLDRLRALAPALLETPLLTTHALIELDRFAEAERELRSLESRDAAGIYRDRIRELRERIGSLRAGRQLTTGPNVRPQ